MIEEYHDNKKASDRSIVRGLLWKAVENGGDQIITFVISIILARLLGPERYGTLSLMLVFIAVANVIIQSGFQTSLIQKKQIEDEDLSSVFWMGLGISALLYALIFMSAPYAADYFGDEAISPMLRVLALMLFFGAVVSVETAIISRRMDFRLQFIATIAADLFSGAIGIAAAFLGLGTWALVCQQLFKYFFLMIFMILLVRWRPEIYVSMSRLRSLFSFGWKMLVSGLIDTIYNNMYTPVIQKLYSPAMVGYYNRGNQFPQIIANSVSQTMQAVMLPAFSKAQDEEERLRELLSATVRMGCFLMFPMMAGLMAVSEELVLLMLGEEWLEAVPMLRLCCLSYAVWPMHVANLQAINARGRSDIFLKLEIIKKLIGVAVLVFSSGYGIAAMLCMKALFDLLCTFINAAPNAFLLGYGPVRQWRGIIGELGLSALMGTVVFALGGFMTELGMEGGSYISILLVTMLKVALGILIYLGGAWLLRLRSMKELLAYCRETVRGKGR